MAEATAPHEGTFWMSRIFSRHAPLHAATSRRRQWLSTYGVAAVGVATGAGLIALVAFLGISTVGIAAPAPATPASSLTQASVMSASQARHAAATHAVTALMNTVAQAAHPFTGGPHTVVSGDTLSGVASAAYQRAGCWPGIYRASKKVIGSDPDVIVPGQQLRVPRGCDSRPVATPAPAHVVVDVTQQASSLSQPRRSSHHSAVRRSSISGDSASSGSGYAVSSSFQACVIRAESGGNAQVMNSSSHYGLYQFSYSTWVAAGGAPSLFGHASAAYQTTIFWKAYGLWGVSPWRPYDGC